MFTAATYGPGWRKVRVTERRRRPVAPCFPSGFCRFSREQTRQTFHELLYVGSTTRALATKSSDASIVTLLALRRLQLTAVGVTGSKILNWRAPSIARMSRQF